MKNNYTPQSFDEIVKLELSDGFAAGIVAFVTRYNIKFDPTEGCQDPLVRFCMMLTAEELKDLPYPFKDSVKEKMVDAVASELMVLRLLYDRHEMKNLRAFCRLIGGECSASFLEDHKDEAIKIINNLRDGKE